MGHPNLTKFRHWLLVEFQPKRLLPNLTLGILMGITEVVFGISIASLIFSGALTPYLSFGIGIALITATIMLIGVSLGSSIPGITGGSQDGPSVILAVIAASLVGMLSAKGVADPLKTVLATIAVTSLLTGLFFLILGYFKLGGLVRYIPYPVVGGFLAGAGWLLLRGSFSVMTTLPLTTSTLPLLFLPDQLILWVPGVLLAFVLYFSLQRLKHILVFPAILSLTIALFYIALAVLGISIEDAISQGILLGEVSGEAIWQPLQIDNLVSADWGAILIQSGNIAIVLLVSVVSLLLNASALEVILGQDVDLNRELRVAGFMNLISGLGGGSVAYHALDLSTLCCRIGARSRLPGVVAGIFTGVILFAGTPLLAYLPTPILGGLLFFMGLGFLVDWVIKGWSKLSRAEFGVVILILIVIATTNLLAGVGVGLVAMIILFVLGYSRISVVHHTLTGAETRSNVERCAYHRRVLTELGQNIYILKLQGFLFFGSATPLLEQIRRRANQTDGPQVRHIILDFRRVTGLDSSAVICFTKSLQLAEAEDFILILTNLSGGIKAQLARGGLGESVERLRLFPDLDHGLEWCEDQLLSDDKITLALAPESLRSQLRENGFEEANITRLTAFLERIELEENQFLIRQGDQADDLYFIESGSVSVYLEAEDGKRLRLQRLGPGTIVGELGLYLDITRTASVVVDSPTVAYRLTLDALEQMTGEAPKLAASFHELIARMLAERLIETNRFLEAVLR